MTNNNEGTGQSVENNEEKTTELSLETPEQEAARLAGLAEEVIAENKAADASLAEATEAETAEILALTDKLHNVTDESRGKYASEVDQRAQKHGSTAEGTMLGDALKEDYYRTANNPMFPHNPTAAEKNIDELKSKLGL